MAIKTFASNLSRKIFGTQNDRELKSIYPIVAQINQLEAKIKPLTDEQLRGKTAEFKQRLANGETLDDILPEAFAVVREAAWRVRGERHYDVQLIGGITLHRGRIAEMRTGEGKTLVATLPSYLNALSGKGVHVVTVNDYLARRDSQQMGAIHKFLGLTTGIIVHGLTDTERQQNYACDITYGTNNEFGFDYLRDNMKFRLEDYVQRELNFSIVDEVDSILIDEARTPLIISGPTDDSTDLYYQIDTKLLEGGALVAETDYTVEEKTKTAALTLDGIQKMEKRLGVANLYDPQHIELLHHVNQALRAHVLFKRDKDYVVKDGEVLIVDEFTGRLMPGRRWSDGLHQAIEAKEGVTIENENQTLATITFQNYFRMYNKLSGMTGTADTEATEFKEIYKLDVTVIPTNRPMVRQDEADVIFKSESGKLKAIAKEIKELQAKGQPVLVGTVSVEKSEMLSGLLKREGIKHSVLNAKQHEREAYIVAQAGRKGAVTIATNMAGRGTDILLGGNAEFLARAEVGDHKPAPEATPEEIEAGRIEHEKKVHETIAHWKAGCEKEREEVRQAGGLFILGTERHESRRIDNQLRGRAGRQGDPGASRFFLSLEDDLMRIFGSVNIGRFMEEDMPIEHPWITKAIANAQKKVEGHNYDIRKHLLEYDDVMNQQRKVIYEWRREVLSSPNLHDMALQMIDEVATNIAQDFFPNGKLRRDHSGNQNLDVNELNTAIRNTLSIETQIQEREISPFNDQGLKKLIMEIARRSYDAKTRELGDDTIHQLEKMIFLSTIDHLWKEHLLGMDGLREGVGLNAYGQKDPLIEYKKQGFRFFEMMMGMITSDVVQKIFAVQLAQGPAPTRPLTARERELSLEQELEAHERAAAQAQAQSMQYNLSEDGELIPVDPAKARHAHPAEAQAEQGQPLPAQAQAAPDFMSQLRAPHPSRMTLSRGGGGVATAVSQNDVEKVGRNDVCPCGSGKKYKKCHGA
ncbi:MAG: preprotein translocase subunit SecA [Oligoflexia bacterium]|nr:preprotein translocase subunit SecA [Oligoflexia bacterium]